LIRRLPASPTAGLAAVSAVAGRLAVRLVPAHLRRVYVPPAYSAIDRAAVVIFGFTCGIFQAVGRFPMPQDAEGYWIANLDSLYPVHWGVDGQYIYPPPLAQIVTLLHPLGWGLFIVMWTTLLWAAMAYMLGRWSWLFVGLGIAALLLRLPYEFSDVLGHALNGNVQLLIAAGLVFALRGNVLGWLPGLLTKVVSGIGLGWYVFRAEWRPLILSIAAAAAVAAVSFAFSPNQWVQWVDWTVANAGTPSPIALEPIPFSIRLPMSLAVLLWGARTNRAWVVPIAVGWGTPALYLGTYPSMWIAAIPLYLDARARRLTTPGPEPRAAAATVAAPPERRSALAGPAPVASPHRRHDLRLMSPGVTSGHGTGHPGR